TIGGISDDTVMAASAPTQTQPNTFVDRPNNAVLTTSAGCPSATNSCAKGLPVSMPTSATSKIPAVPSGSIQGLAVGSPIASTSTASTENVAIEPTSRMVAGFRAARPIANPTTATASAISVAVSDGTLPTSTQ